MIAPKIISTPQIFLSICVPLDATFQYKYFFTISVNVPARTKTPQCPRINARINPIQYNNFVEIEDITIPRIGVIKARAQGPNANPKTKPRINPLT